MLRTIEGEIMKRAAIILSVCVVVLAMASSGAAQAAQPANQNQAQGQAQGQASPQPAAGQTAAPGIKRPPQAKTVPEFEAYKAAVANQNDPAALEKAADDFAAKFPNSELTPLLYRATMRGYQSANNTEKLMEASQKLLKADPDDPEALVNVAEVIAEQVHETDIDKAQRYDEARKDAQKALQTVETDVPSGVPPEKVDDYKGLLKSNAYSILGTLDFNDEKYPEAEANFRKSIDAYPQPDPVVVLRLALSLDKQNKYPEALKEANHAVDLTQDGTPAGKLARQERDRLAALTGGAAKPVTATPPAPAGNQPH
jgi:tetratricopeptide (TPR) repeat protein